MRVIGANGGYDKSVLCLVGKFEEVGIDNVIIFKLILRGVGCGLDSSVSG
jgi:hypothetical protein